MSKMESESKAREAGQYGQRCIIRIVFWYSVMYLGLKTCIFVPQLSIQGLWLVPTFAMGFVDSECSQFIYWLWCRSKSPTLTNMINIQTLRYVENKQVDISFFLCVVACTDVDIANNGTLHWLICFAACSLFLLHVQDNVRGSNICYILTVLYSLQSIPGPILWTTSFVFFQQMYSLMLLYNEWRKTNENVSGMMLCACFHSIMHLFVISITAHFVLHETINAIYIHDTNLTIYNHMTKPQRNFAYTLKHLYMQR
jgi:hypothetical protein